MGGEDSGRAQETSTRVCERGRLDGLKRLPYGATVILRYVILIAALSVAGCSTTEKKDFPSVFEPGKSKAAREEVTGYGLKFFPGIGWKYIRPGMSAEILDKPVPKRIEAAEEALKAGNEDEALFAAKSIILETPMGEHAKKAHRIVAEVNEKWKFYEHAFNEYQLLLKKFPEYEEREVILKKQFEICDRYLGGQRFRWKLPYTESAYLPLPNWLTFSFVKTAGMYGQLVSNAPFGGLSAQAQLKKGQSYEKSIGFFSDGSEFVHAIAAYELVTDRYRLRRTGDRLLDAPYSDQLLRDKSVADAQFGIGRVYQRQVLEGVYDQTLTGKAIDAFEDYRALYKDSETEKMRVAEALERIEAMKIEQARGALSTALYYEKNQKWLAAQKYHQQVIGITQGLASDKHRAETDRMRERARTRVQELFTARVDLALKSFAAASKIDTRKKADAALQLYREVVVNLQGMAPEQWGVKDAKKIARSQEADKVSRERIAELQQKRK